MPVSEVVLRMQGEKGGRCLSQTLSKLSLCQFPVLPAWTCPASHSGGVWREAKFARVQSRCHPEVTLHPAALWGTEGHVGRLHPARHPLRGCHRALQRVREHSPGAQCRPWPSQRLRPGRGGPLHSWYVCSVPPTPPWASDAPGFDGDGLHGFHCPPVSPLPSPVYDLWALKSDLGSEYVFITNGLLGPELVIASPSWFLPPSHRHSIHPLAYCEN